MSDPVNTGKRDFLKGAANLGAVSGVIAAAGAAVTPREVLAQALETGVRDDSTLAKIRKEGVLRIGYAQTGPGSTRMPRPTSSAGSTRTSLTGSARSSRSSPNTRRSPGPTRRSGCGVAITISSGRP
jgi:hypothetical protein